MKYTSVWSTVARVHRLGVFLARIIQRNALFTRVTLDTPPLSFSPSVSPLCSISGPPMNHVFAFQTCFEHYRSVVACTLRQENREEPSCLDDLHEILATPPHPRNWYARVHTRVVRELHHAPNVPHRLCLLARFRVGDPRVTPRVPGHCAIFFFSNVTAPTRKRNCCLHGLLPANVVPLRF